jgi:hypothetical protein
MLNINFGTAEFQTLQAETFEIDLDDFEISAPQWPKHHSFAGTGDVLDIVVHKNARLSNVIVSDILDSE